MPLVLLKMRGRPQDKESVAMKRYSIGFFGVICSFTSVLALAQRAPASAGWYTNAQAASGAKAYQTGCSSWHGAKLQGNMGPTLIGKGF
jgi:mono/diheme cytochrome c family protein